ncbi:histidine kinase dimerization/phospho-acceptor domain-containing protein [Microbispora corallina]|uniref:Signal transduction histidine-protein kinase/phosphatase MprB n=1 Tax=Microbispora corallina TaxID=83302 RepID=A0ABQ4G2Q8_9ACTN|nr:HAMP domain-containing sensor histidine kinase [Microbispora corallina]GIH41347.1 two-component sensor histidine kinase [Microbispora corallina]
MNPTSLRWKIAALVAVGCCAVTAVVGVLVHRATFDRSMRLGEDDALQALTQIEQEYARTGTAPADAMKEPGELPAELRQRLAPPETGALSPVLAGSTCYVEERPGQPWMWAAARVGGQVLVARIEMGPELRSLQALDRHMVLAALAALGVILPVTVLAAELPNRRLRRVAATARRIADGDLDARTEARGRDEIADISAAVDSMAANLQRRLLAEQRFTADIAHDLRTPLMGLLTATELLPESEATDLVRDRVRVLRSLVEDLLEVSRLDAGAEEAERLPVPLDRLTAESLSRLGLTAEVTVVGDPVAETDPRRLDRIVANLVVNAHRHGRPPVEIGVSGRTIVVRDHGPGFPGDLLADGPRRFRTGRAERGGGHGLGLTIAVGQARVIGARLRFGNAPDGGAIVTLELPA